jgi:hypothetical protein
LPDPRADLVEMERLHQIVHRAERQAAHGDIDVRDCRDHDHGRVGIASPHFPQEREAIHARHPDVGQDHGHRAVGEHGECGFGRCRLLTRESLALHQAAYGLAEMGFVVYDEAG